VRTGESRQREGIFYRAHGFSWERILLTKKIVYPFYLRGHSFTSASDFPLGIAYTVNETRQMVYTSLWPPCSLFYFRRPLIHLVVGHLWKCLLFWEYYTYLGRFDTKLNYL
jgi:hypothetical protein